MTRLALFLERHRRIALDSSIFIYHLDAHPQYLPLTDQIFSWLEQLRAQAVTSTLTMTEVLVDPYRKTDPRRVASYYGLVATVRNLIWIPVDLKIADLAARAARPLSSKDTGCLTGGHRRTLRRKRDDHERSNIHPPPGI